MTFRNYGLKPQLREWSRPQARRIGVAMNRTGDRQPRAFGWRFWTGVAVVVIVTAFYVW